MELLVLPLKKKKTLSGDSVSKDWERIKCVGREHVTEAFHVYCKVMREKEALWGNWRKQEEGV